MVTYDHPDVPGRAADLRPVHARRAVHRPTRSTRIAAQTGQGKDLRILLDNGWGDGDHEAVSWPFEWYLRDYKTAATTPRPSIPSINLADYPVLLARSTNLDPIQDELAQYTCQKYKLNAWFPEDYKAFTATDTPGFALGTHRFEIPWLRFDVIGQTLSNPDNRSEAAQVPAVPRGARRHRRARDAVLRQQENPALGPAPLGGAAARLAPAAGARGCSAAPPAPRDAVLQTAARRHAPSTAEAASGSPALADPEERRARARRRCTSSKGARARVTRVQRRRHRRQLAGAARARVTASSRSRGASRWRRTATSTSPTPGTTASSTSIRTASSSASGGAWATPRAAPTPTRASSGGRARSPSARPARSTSPTPATSASRCSGSTARSSACSAATATRPASSTKQVGLASTRRATSGWPIPGTAASRS